MTWESLVEAAARQGAEMYRLVQDGVAGVPALATIAFFVRLQRSMMGWKKLAGRVRAWRCHETRGIVRPGL